MRQSLAMLFALAFFTSACSSQSGVSPLPTTGTTQSTTSAASTNIDSESADTATSVATGTGTTTFYVSPTGSDSNTGTLAQPFKTIQKAASVAYAGETVIVENGTYTGPAKGYLVVLPRSGTSTSPITFEAQNTLGATLDGNSFTSLGAFDFNANSEGYIHIEGFNIQNFLDVGILMNSGSNGISDGNNNALIENNHIHNIGNVMSCSDYGIMGIYAAQGTRNVSIVNNQINNIGRTNTASQCAPHGSSDHGLYLGGGDYTITGNDFHDNDAGWDIQIAGHPNDLNTGYEIEHNTFGTHKNVGGNPGNIVLWADGGNTPAGTLEDNSFAGGSGPPLYCYPSRALGDPLWIIEGNTLPSGVSISSCTGVTVST